MHQLGLGRRLVRRGDAGELLDLAGARLLVEPLHVALLADLDRAVDEDLDEVARLHDRAHLIAVGAVRRDEGRQRHDAGVGEELRDLADAADVLGAVLGREAEILVEPVADVVAVEDVGADAALDGALLELDRDRRLAGAREPREPDGAALVAVQLLAVLARDRALVPDDVRRFLLSHEAQTFTDLTSGRQAIERTATGASPRVEARGRAARPESRPGRAAGSGSPRRRTRRLRRRGRRSAAPSAASAR